MKFTWDERKRQSNLRKHGVDFADAPGVFDGYTLTAEDDRARYGELRYLTLGLLNGVVVSVAHTERGDEIRIISMRKATRNETHFYFSQFAD